MDFVAKFRDLERKFIDIEREMTDPAVVSDINRYNDLNKRRLELEEPVQKFREYQKTVAHLTELEEILDDNSDKDLVELAREELPEIKQAEEQQHQELLVQLVPKDPNDRHSAYIEIRSGTGGEEAALFARDIHEMYIRYVQSKGWKYELVDVTEADAGGYAKIITYIQGDGAFGRLKYESGIHRVQRVPVTEASGRLHTSAATVAIMPEVDNVEVDIDQRELRIDTYRSSGAGGQHVNKTDSAVRITHEPTGVVVTCQDDRSQHKNKEKAMNLLKSKLWELRQKQQQKQESALRKTMVGSGDRSEKIRTYNYPQNRVTDHRIGLSLYKLDQIIMGDVDDLIEALITADRLEKLKHL